MSCSNAQKREYILPASLDETRPLGKLTRVWLCARLGALAVGILGLAIALLLTYGGKLV